MGQDDDADMVMMATSSTINDVTLDSASPGPSGFQAIRYLAPENDDVAYHAHTTVSYSPWRLGVFERLD